MVSITLILVVVSLIFVRFNGFGSDEWISVEVNDTNYIVELFEKEKKFHFNSKLTAEPKDLSRVEKLILLSQSDYLKFISNNDARLIYGRCEATDKLIDSQRNYVIKKSNKISCELSFKKMLVALDRYSKVCYLIVFVESPNGIHYAQFEYIKNDWYVVAGLSNPPKIVFDASDLIDKLNTEKVDIYPYKKLDSIMRRLSASFLE